MPQLSLHTPVGDLTVSEENDRIVALDWGWGRDQSNTSGLIEARRQLQAFFVGELAVFALPLAPSGTAYRKLIWQAIGKISTGETRTYLQVAQTAGGSAQSIGGAMAANPIPIIIPCHRVVATRGPGGYSGGDGLSTKHFLLGLERRIAGFPPLAWAFETQTDTAQERLELS